MSFFFFCRWRNWGPGPRKVCTKGHTTRSVRLQSPKRPLLNPWIQDSQRTEGGQSHLNEAFIRGFLPEPVELMPFTANNTRNRKLGEPTGKSGRRPFPGLEVLAVPLKETVFSAETHPKDTLTAVCHSKEPEVVWMVLSRGHENIMQPSTRTT